MGAIPKISLRATVILSSKQPTDGRAEPKSNNKRGLRGCYYSSQAELTGQKPNLNAGPLETLTEQWHCRKCKLPILRIFLWKDQREEKDQKKKKTNKQTHKKPCSLMEFQAHLQKYTVNIKHIKTDFHIGWSQPKTSVLALLQNHQE